MMRRISLAVRSAALVRPLLSERPPLQWAAAALSSSASLIRRVAPGVGKKIRARAALPRSETRAVIRASQRRGSLRRTLPRSRPRSRSSTSRSVRRTLSTVARLRKSATRRVRRPLRAAPTLRRNELLTPAASAISTTTTRTRNRQIARLDVGATGSRRSATASRRLANSDDATSLHIASRRVELCEADARIAMRGLMSQYFRVAGRPVSEENSLRRRKAAELCKPLLERSEWKEANTLAQNVAAVSERLHTGSSREKSRAAPGRRLWNGPRIPLTAGAETGPMSVSLEPPSWDHTGASSPYHSSSTEPMALESGESDELPDYGALDVDEGMVERERRDR